MKLLGSGADDGRARSQDDAAVGYVFQRHVHDPEFPQFVQKQSRWASGDETILDNQDKWKYNGPMNSMSGGVGSILNPTAKIVTQQMQQQQQQHQPQQTPMMNQMQQQHHMAHISGQHHLAPPHQQQLMHQMNNNAMSNNNLNHHMHPQNHHIMNHLAAGTGNGGGNGNHLQQQPSQMQNQSMVGNAAGMPLQMTTIQGGGGGGIYDHHQSMVAAAAAVQNGGMHPAVGQTNQYMTNRNSVIASSAAKKLWEKGGPGDISVNSGAPLPPLQLHSGTDNQVWRDSTWSNQGEVLAPRRTFAHECNSGGSAGILSPRDATGGLGVKMVEYVLGGSPTNKESPLAGLEPRLRSLKFDDADKANEEKNKQKDEQVTSNGVNGLDDDKGFNRTPGSRQPSPADEALTRPTNLLDPSSAYPHMHMLNSCGDHTQNHHMNSYHQQRCPTMPNDNQRYPLQGGAVLNGDPFFQNTMQQQQGQNQLDSSALVQQQHNFDVQQLFRQQNPNLTANANAAGQPQPIPQFLAQQNAYAAAAAAAQQPYVINPGQEAAPYMGLIPTGMHPQYYGVATAPWGVYSTNLIPQQGTQPRRPLTPSQQGAENAPYQVISFYDQSGSLVMGPRTGTPMRLVSPAPMMVPPGAPRAQAPQIYPPQQSQQNVYSQQNGSSVGGGLALNTSSLSGRRDSFDRNTSAFSPSSLDYTTTAGMANGTRTSVAGTVGKWPIGSYGGLGTVATASGSPHGAPITPPPTGLGALVSNRAPGAESKYRNVAPVGMSASTSAAAAIATNPMFGSNSSIFSKLVRPTANVTSTAVSAAPGAAGSALVDRQTGRSRLLEDFRNQRYPNLQLRDLTNHIVEFSQDQHGSRFIQQKLERATSAEKQLVFTEILGAAYNLMTDVFGNYVIQKFFEYGTPEQKQTLAQQVKGHVLPLALQMYGCRVIQKALESIPADHQQEIVRELDGHVLKCVKDQNGNHVVQKCIECVEPCALQFIINAFQGQVYTLSTHPYGCRVIQRILEHCTTEQTAPILAELHSNTNQLIEDQYGNYVIQHVLEHGKPEDKSILIAGVRGRVLSLSQHKFASNVVEKCVTHATRAERAILIEEVCALNDSALHIMMKDQYANYVVQKMIDVSEPTQRKILMHKIRPHMNSLRKYTYGKHIIAKIEKFFTKTSNTVGGGVPTSAGTVPVMNGTGSVAPTTNGTNVSVQSGTGSNGTANSCSPASVNGMSGDLGPIGPPTTNGGI